MLQLLSGLQLQALPAAVSPLCRCIISGRRSFAVDSKASNHQQQQQEHPSSQSQGDEAVWTEVVDKKTGEQHANVSRERLMASLCLRHGMVAHHKCKLACRSSENAKGYSRVVHVQQGHHMQVHEHTLAHTCSIRQRTRMHEHVHARTHPHTQEHTTNTLHTTDWTP